MELVSKCDRVSVCPSAYLVLCRAQRQCDLCQLGADLRGNRGMEAFVFYLLAICDLLQSLPLRLNTAMSRLAHARDHRHTANVHHFSHIASVCY